MNSYSVLLDHFEGTLDLLVHLIQKREVDPAEIAMMQITGPFLEKIQQENHDSFDMGADFILLASQIALLKSKHLLPRRGENEEDLVDNEEDPRFDIIHHLIDYCRFKEAAGLFSEMEVKQNDFYPRGLKFDPLDDEPKMPTGLSGVTLDELGGLFQEILKKAIVHIGQIGEEEFRVQDKILMIRSRINREKRVLFETLFEGIHHKTELIVTFLALLELMKIGDLKVIKNENELIEIIKVIL